MDRDSEHVDLDRKPAAISPRAFLYDLRWMLPVTVSFALILWAFNFAGLRDSLRFIEIALGSAGMTLILGPIVWIRMKSGQTSGRDPAFWQFGCLAIVWLIIGIVGMWAVFEVLDAK